MQIKLSDHFTYGRLLRYTLPSIIMMIFTSLYSVVDGLFVSNLVGDLALSAVNIAFPITMIIGAFGFMLGTGGSAIVARTLGEGKPELALKSSKSTSSLNCPCQYILIFSRRKLVYKLFHYSILIDIVLSR